MECSAGFSSWNRENHVTVQQKWTRKEPKNRVQTSENTMKRARKTEKNRFGPEFPPESWLIASASLFAVYNYGSTRQMLSFVALETETRFFSLSKRPSKFSWRKMRILFFYWWLRFSRMLSHECIWEPRPIYRFLSQNEHTHQHYCHSTIKRGLYFYYPTKRDRKCSERDVVVSSQPWKIHWQNRNLHFAIEL